MARTAILIFSILIVMFVLNRNFNQNLVCKGSKRSSRKERFQKRQSILAGAPEIPRLNLQDPEPNEEAPISILTPKSEYGKSKLLTDGGVMISHNLERPKYFDHLILNLFWPQTICAKFHTEKLNLPYDQLSFNRQFLNQLDHRHFRDCVGVITKHLSQAPAGASFTIHGLWPARGNRAENDPNNPEFCHGEPYELDSNKLDGHKDFEKIENIFKYWPSIIWSHQIYKEHLFWKHEWTRHGTCAAFLSAIKNRVGYFEKTLELYRNLEPTLKHIMSILTSFKSPQNKETNVRFLLSNVEAFYGYSIALNYEKFELSGKPVEFWVESINFCYDLSLQPKNCPPSSVPRGVLLPNLDDVESIINFKKSSRQFGQ